MEYSKTQNFQEPKLQLKDLFRSLGPGIMMASAAVGGSHLVASTKAGAIYGWQLLFLILAVNLLKYPFFRASVQYTVGTGESIIQGYDKLGRGYLWVFLTLCAISAVINTSALLLFSASLLGYFFPFDLSFSVLSIVVLITCVTILFAGHFKALDLLSKIIMLILSITTVTALLIAFSNGAVAPIDYQGPSVFSISSIGFLVITMGWMPAPIEISSITSMWLKRQAKTQKITAQSALFDFNIGYIGTAILAVVFLSLGALVLYGSGVEFKASGISFSHQLISIYASTIGEWSRYLIAIIAFFCIFGSTITVIDGYARAVSEAQLLIQDKPLDQPEYYSLWVSIISVLSIIIVTTLTSSLMGMLNFAMIISFITTPVFALLNYRLVTKTELPYELKMGQKLKIFSIIGLIYLFGFLAIFIWWNWFL